MMNSDRGTALFRDWQFALALLAGPAIWLGMYVVFQPQLSLWWLDDPLKLLMVGLLYPVLEEFVFRGGVQGWLIEKPWGVRSLLGITYANGVTSAVFTSLHFFAHPPLMAAAVFVPSLLFGYFRDRYAGWLLPSMILHSLYNTGYFILFGG